MRHETRIWINPQDVRKFMHGEPIVLDHDGKITMLMYERGGSAKVKKLSKNSKHAPKTLPILSKGFRCKFCNKLMAGQPTHEYARHVRYAHAKKK